MCCVFECVVRGKLQSSFDGQVFHGCPGHPTCSQTTGTLSCTVPGAAGSPGPVRAFGSTARWQCCSSAFTHAKSALCCMVTAVGSRWACGWLGFQARSFSPLRKELARGVGHFHGPQFLPNWPDLGRHLWAALSAAPFPSLPFQEDSQWAFSFSTDPVSQSQRRCTGQEMPAP